MENFGDQACILAAHLDCDHALALVEEKQEGFRQHLNELDEKANKSVNSWKNKSRTLTKKKPGCTNKPRKMAVIFWSARCC